jgi:ubiquitin-protein ligase E3 C
MPIVTEFIARSPNAVAHLKILNMLVFPDVVARNLGPQGRDVAANILLYVLKRGFYSLLSEAIRSIVSCLLFQY